MPVALCLCRDLPVAAAGGVKLLDRVANPGRRLGVAKRCRARIAGERRVLVERVLRRVRIFLLDLEAGMDRLPPRPRYVKGVDVEGGDVGLHVRARVDETIAIEVAPADKQTLGVARLRDQRADRVRRRGDAAALVGDLCRRQALVGDDLSELLRFGANEDPEQRRPFLQALEVQVDCALRISEGHLARRVKTSRSRLRSGT